MDPLTLGLIAVAVYLFVLKPAGQQLVTTGGITPPARAQTTQTGFGVTIPGVGSYQNTYGGGQQLTFNPDLFSSFFGRGVQPAQPVTTQEALYAYDPVTDTPIAPSPDAAVAYPYWADAQADFYGPGDYYLSV